MFPEGDPASDDEFNQSLDTDHKKDGAKSLNGEGEKLNILIAEDIPLNQMLIKQYLRNSSYTYEMVENGKMVIERLEKLNPKTEASFFDVILMDIQMPIMGGLEATQVIRSLKSDFNKIPIIALTANAHDEMKKECLEMGFSGFISKPFTKGDLEVELKKLNSEL